MNIVLLHGLTGSQRYFKDLKVTLSTVPDARVASFDLLGFGENYTNSSGLFTLKEQLEHITHKINKSFGTEPITIIGHSLGGVLGIAWARQHPDQVSKLVLINTPLASTPEEARQSILDVRKKFLNWSYLILRYRPFAFLACKLLCRLNGMRFFEFLKPSYISHEVFEDYRRHSWKSLTETLDKIFLSFPAGAVLSSLPIPTLIISGSTDSDIMRRHPQSFTITNIELEGGHQLLLENPQTTNKHIADFVSR